MAQYINNSIRQVGKLYVNCAWVAFAKAVKVTRILLESRSKCISLVNQGFGIIKLLF